MEKLFFGENDVLFYEGEKASAALIIEAGSVLLCQNQKNGFKKDIAELGPGSIIGELSLLTGNPHSVTAKSIEAGHALVLSRAELDSRLSKSDKVVSLMLKSIAARLRGTYAT